MPPLGSSGALCFAGVMPQYESFAREFLEHALDAPYNAHYDRPAMLELIGDVRGTHVLDAGCGPGLYAEQLVAAGATVMGIDNSPAMVALARERVNRSATFRVHDLDRPLDWLPSASFDIVVSALVLHYVSDPTALMEEFHRVLRPGGVAVISNQHPTSDWVRLGGSYFAVEEFTETFSKGWVITTRHAPMQYWCDAFTDAGFLIQKLVEPRPADSMKDAHPQVWEKLNTEPAFFAVRLVKAAV